MNRRIWLLIASFVFPASALFGLSVWWSPATQAAQISSINVDTLDDELNSDGDCSLREAITAANKNAAIDACPAGNSLLTDTITFSVTGTITLTEQLSVTWGGPVMIDGGEEILISGDNRTRIFFVEDPARLSIANVSLSDGRTVDVNYENHGGAILNRGVLEISNSHIANNIAVDTVLNYGNYGTGGGIINYGVLTITQTTLSNNGAYGGGAIRNENGFLFLENTSFNFNGAAYGGGIDNASGVVHIDQCDFAGNSAETGGGINNSVGSVTIHETTFIGNTSFFEGGGISNTGGNSYVGVIRSSFLYNSANSGYGGGIYHNIGVVEVEDSTFYRNTANYGGAIYHDIELMRVINSTFTENDAVLGGGIYTQGELTMINSTLSGNSAGSGGGIYRTSGMAEIDNTILNASEPGENCWGWIIDGGQNIDSGNSCGFSAANGSLPNTDPVIGSLQDNGGPNWTHALLEGSPAIDAANPNNCPSADQRGVPRPIDGDGDGTAICDIGSFEYLIPVSLTLVTINGPLMGDVQVSHTFTATVSPLSATVPITFVWQATGETPIIHTGGITDPVTFVWDLPGTKVLTVTASNLLSTVTDSHTITVTPRSFDLYLPFIQNSMEINHSVPVTFPGWERQPAPEGMIKIDQFGRRPGV